MKYYKMYKDDLDNRFEVSRETALNTLLGTYQDNEETRGMLDVEMLIPCQFSYIETVDE